MTGLAEWLERQRRPLPFSLWLELSMGVARIDALIKQEHFSEARVALAALTATARQHNLPAWGALLHLLESSLTLAANGDLGRTLDLAFRALTTVEKLADPTHRPLQLCARLAVARCWLKMDEIGYAPDVARLIHTTLAEGDTGEWWFWYQASLAWALWALNHHEEADSILTRMLADFPGWMARPDQIEARAYIAYRMRRLLDAAQYYGECAAAFEAEGQRYAGVRCELNRAPVLIRRTGTLGSCRATAARMAGTRISGRPVIGWTTRNVSPIGSCASGAITCIKSCGSSGRPFV